MNPPCAFNASELRCKWDEPCTFDYKTGMIYTRIYTYQYITVLMIFLHNVVTILGSGEVNKNCTSFQIAIERDELPNVGYYGKT